MRFVPCVIPLAALVVVCTASRAADAPADRIIRGGPIVTVNAAQPAAEAVAIAGGRIVAVGTEADVMKHKGPATELTDLGGKTLVPGFVDGHSHFWSLVDVQTQALCASPPAGPCRSVADVIAALEAVQTRRKLGPGKFVIGFGYDPELLAERRPPTKQELDAAFPDNPVMLVHVSGHGAMLNSKALATYGITASTPTPEGGVIGREPGSNEPNGLLFETAFLPIFSKVPGPGDDEALDLLKAGQEFYLQNGITTAQEGATMKHQLDLLRILADRGDLKLDVVALPFITELDAVFGDKPPANEPEYRNRLRIGGVKVVADGSPQGRTAAFTTPYLVDGPAGQKDWRGELSFPQATLNEWVKKVYDGGATLFVHCNGDAPVRLGRRSGEAPGHGGGALAVHPPRPAREVRGLEDHPLVLHAPLLLFRRHPRDQPRTGAGRLHQPHEVGAGAGHPADEPHRLQRLATQPAVHDPHGRESHLAVGPDDRRRRADRAAGGPRGDHDRRGADARRGTDEGLDRAGQAGRSRDPLGQPAHGAAGHDRGDPRGRDDQGRHHRLEAGPLTPLSP
jgi:hypothetical protein